MNADVSRRLTARVASLIGLWTHLPRFCLDETSGSGRARTGIRWHLSDLGRCEAILRNSK